MATRRGHIVINQEMCKGCELCTTVCPYDLIHMADHYNAKGYKPAEFTDPEGRCTGCTLCAMICPDAVITVFRRAKVRPAAAPRMTSASQTELARPRAAA